MPDPAVGQQWVCAYPLRTRFYPLRTHFVRCPPRPVVALPGTVGETALRGPELCGRDVAGAAAQAAGAAELAQAEEGNGQVDAADFTFQGPVPDAACRP